MIAFHSFWSLPNHIRNGEQIDFPDYELLTMMLSALTWKRENGSIYMITDSKGADYFCKLGLNHLWDRLDTTLDGIEDVDPWLFWAAGKLYALKSMQLPCVMLDTDLIIWKNLDNIWQADCDVIAAHAEDTVPWVYPDPSTFSMKDGYSMPKSWDFRQDAANTAFLYLKSSGFRDYYVSRAMEFFRSLNPEGLNPVTAMCFAEQRILPLCAKEKGQKLGFLLDGDNLNHQTFATHIWGYKRQLRQDPKERELFCQKCLRRIEKDFPDWKKQAYAIVADTREEKAEDI